MDAVVYNFPVPAAPKEMEYIAIRLLRKKREQFCRERTRVVIAFPYLQSNLGCQAIHPKSYSAQWGGQNWSVQDPNKTDQQLRAAEIETLTLNLQEALYCSPYITVVGRPHVNLTEVE